MRTVFAAGLALSLSFVAAGLAQTRPVNDEYGDFYRGDQGNAADWVDVIRVTQPAYRSNVQGKVRVEFTAKDMVAARALCWQQPTPADSNAFGHDQTVAANITLDHGGGAFEFNADEFPNGPITLRIQAHDAGGKHDLCELQLYNTGGVKWKQGMPADAPPGAEGMKVAFSDDFDGPLSISKDGIGARYNAHKPTYGDFSGWPFTSPAADGKPFSQVGTYLKISATKAAGTKGETGLIAPVAMDGTGFWAKPPCYLECRFIAQSAPGTWPAFWTITGIGKGKGPGDELDIIEAYGGFGKKNPNYTGYSPTSHFWNQTNEQGGKKKGVSRRVPMLDLGGKSSWSTTFHTYGVRIGLDDTVYYLDDIEVLRHPTNEISKQPHCFLINYAIGGISGWHIDLDRYGNASDMYVDYIRVYQK